MDPKTTDWRAGPNVCRCCLAEGCYKDISTEYFWMGKREVYAEMLSETLNLSIAYSNSGGPNSNSRLICELCISRLRDASDFKRQVQECERTFLRHLDPGSSSMVGEVEVTVEPTEIDPDVKLEHVKQEKAVSDDDDDFDERCGFDEDDDDDLDDQPLTRLASRIPKKESVDLLDLLDNTKATEKRKSSSKTKTVPAKKAKTIKKDVKATSSKAPVKTEKKKKGNTVRETSVWQLTVSERKNAAIFIQHTTVRPFIFIGSNFRCFYCNEYESDISALFEHTATHKFENKDEIFNKYVVNGKRNLQVDISKLKCRICDQNFPNLTVIREHLTISHQIEFCAASNGMTEYKMEMVNHMFVCHLCGEQFHNFNLLNFHVNTHIGKVVCENCGAGFVNQHSLATHKETHLLKLYNCKYCDNSFFKHSQLKYHVQIAHIGGERKLKTCPKCAETFREYSSLISHLRKMHGIAKSFPCHVCKNNLPSRRALTEHRTKYHTEKYKCEVCSKCFSIESKLKHHMRGHTGERNFVCCICKNAYMHKRNLVKHMKYHMNSTSVQEEVIECST
ncbi:zinc finger protein 43-like isoform X15 [Spodoptera litura]|uniref:Zinc finger protein 43-like isoform X15 n=1 Tax=Spodoptera litura TaxID=69820 RepID=A0A9J7DVH4_SPOLT|nr:zinc finger protein 43-like isoform X15 [Spodoptera litura]